MNFEEIGLKEPIVQAVKDMGFEQLTPIQEKTIPFIINGGGDLIALAQTGTGKTAAFGLPVLNMIDAQSKDTQVLVLCPTRELCLQITGDLKNFSSRMKDLEVVPVYGGSSIETQIKQLKKRCQIVVATPGRAIDLMGDLRYAKVFVSVLDKAQEKDVVKGLRSATGYLRRELGAALRLRYTPELQFIADDSIEYGAHILEMLRDPNVVKPANPANETIVLEDDD